MLQSPKADEFYDGYGRSSDCKARLISPSHPPEAKSGMCSISRFTYVKPFTAAGQFRIFTDSLLILYDSFTIQ